MSQKIKILYPIDFSEITANAFPTALHLCQVYDAEMFMIHVLEAPSGPLKLFSNFDEAGARKKANAMMDEFIKKHGDDNVVFNKMIKIGKPYVKILEAANELSANAIVMGTHGASGVSELFVGTNAARVIKTAKCPVITIREKPDHTGFKRILLPLDLTVETGEKLELAIEFAENWGSELILVNILEKNDEEVKKRLQKRMGLALALIKKHNLKAETTTLLAKGNIADLVIDYGREANADLIVIMAQQDLDIKQQLTGSHASHVVNHSNIPVMSIKPKKRIQVPELLRLALRLGDLSTAACRLTDNSDAGKSRFSGT